MLRKRSALARSHCARRLSLESLEEKRLLAFGLFNFLGSSASHQNPAPTSGQLPVVETPVVVDPPVVEEPIIPEPVVETPVVEQPVVEEPVPVVEPVIEEPTEPVSPPVVEEPVNENPTQQEPIVETGLCDGENAFCVHRGDEVALTQLLSAPGPAKTIHIHSDAVLGRLDIVGRSGDTIHFVNGAQIVGHQQSFGYYAPDRGVVNIVNSSDITIVGLRANNTYQYQRANTNGDNQSSTAVNISESHGIRLENSTLISRGKGTLWVHGGSTVELENTEIDTYYFGIGVLASSVSSKNLVINQYNRVVSFDRHASIWVSSSMRNPAGRFFGGTNVSFEDTSINKSTGEGIIAGNGRHDFRSKVKFSRTTDIDLNAYVANKRDGWLSVNENYFGIELDLEGTFPDTTLGIADPARPHEFAAFVSHDTPAASTPPQEAPQTVCIGGNCLSTNHLFYGEPRDDDSINEPEEPTSTTPPTPAPTPPVVEPPPAPPETAPTPEVSEPETTVPEPETPSEPEPTPPSSPELSFTTSYAGAFLGRLRRGRS